MSLRKLWKNIWDGFARANCTAKNVDDNVVTRVPRILHSSLSSTMHLSVVELPFARHSETYRTATGTVATPFLHLALVATKMKHPQHGKHVWRPEWLEYRRRDFENSTTIRLSCG